MWHNLFFVFSDVVGGYPNKASCRQNAVGFQVDLITDANTTKDNDNDQNSGWFEVKKVSFLELFFLLFDDAYVFVVTNWNSNFSIGFGSGLWLICFKFYVDVISFMNFNCCLRVSTWVP